MENAIMVKLKETSLEPEIEQNLKETFMPFFEKAEIKKNEAMKIIVTNALQVEKMQLARNMRLGLKDIRIDVEKIRKKLKEDSLRKGKAIDGMANIIKYLIVPIEQHLEEQEKFVQIENEVKKTEIENKRIDQLKEYEVDIECYDLRNMKEKAFSDLLEVNKINYTNRKKLEEEEEEKRIAIEKVEAKEKEKIKIENQKLKKEAEELKAKEEAKKKEYEESIRIEREKKESIEKELKAKEEAEQKSKLQEIYRIEKEKQEKLKKENDLRLQPDKKKLEQLAIAIVSMEMPEVKCDEAKEIIKNIVEKLNDTSNYIKTQIIKL